MIYSFSISFRSLNIFVDEQSGRLSEKKRILSCRTNYITKRYWCNSIGVAVRVGFNSGGSVAEQLGAPADL